MLEEKGLYPNVDFFAASVYHAARHPDRPVHARVRDLAHVRDGPATSSSSTLDNRLIRPDSEYIGERDQKWVPIERALNRSGRHAASGRSRQWSLIPRSRCGPVCVVVAARPVPAGAASCSPRAFGLAGVLRLVLPDAGGRAARGAQPDRSTSWPTRVLGGGIAVLAIVIPADVPGGVNPAALGPAQ